MNIATFFVFPSPYKVRENGARGERVEGETDLAYLQCFESNLLFWPEVIRIIIGMFQYVKIRFCAIIFKPESLIFKHILVLLNCIYKLF